MPSTSKNVRRLAIAAVVATASAPATACSTDSLLQPAQRLTARMATNGPSADAAKANRTSF